MACQVERLPAPPAGKYIRSASLLEYVGRSAWEKVADNKQNGEVKEEMRTSERGRGVLTRYIDIGLLAGQYRPPNTEKLYPSITSPSLPSSRMPTHTMV